MTAALYFHKVCVRCSTTDAVHLMSSLEGGECYFRDMWHDPLLGLLMCERQTKDTDGHSSSKRSPGCTGGDREYCLIPDLMINNAVIL